MQSYTVVLGSGNSADLPGGLFFILLASTGAVDIEFFRNRTSIGKVSGIEEGYRNKFDKKFDAVKITDVSAAANTVKVGIAQEGDADYNRAFGSVTVADGEIQPVGGAANTASPPDVNAIDVVASLESITAKRTALTDLTGCSYASANNTTVVLATAAANTDGVRIAVADLSISTTTTVARADLRIGPAALINIVGSDLAVIVKDIFIPAGVEVSLYSSLAAATARAAYEVY